jgi:hypothetical protein
METRIDTTKETNTSLEHHFSAFRKHVIGMEKVIETPYGHKPLIYADWIASGRLYGPIEALFTHKIGPYVANTHTNTTTTGSSMTLAYNRARKLIKCRRKRCTDLVGFWNDGCRQQISENTWIAGARELQRQLSYQ